MFCADLSTSDEGGYGEALSRDEARYFLADLVVAGQFCSALCLSRSLRESGVIEESDVLFISSTVDLAMRNHYPDVGHN